MPNKAGLSLLPSGSPQRISTSEFWRNFGCMTRILTILNLSRMACHIFPTMNRSCIVDPSLNTDGNAVAKSKNATYVAWPFAKKLCWIMAMMELIDDCFYYL